jgi:hypothetical protein
MPDNREPEQQAHGPAQRRTEASRMPISRKAIMAATIAQSSWNGKPRDDSDDQGKGSDHDDRPQRDPDCEWHAPISLHGRSDQTRGGFLFHTENLRMCCRLITRFIHAM